MKWEAPQFIEGRRSQYEGDTVEDMLKSYFNELYNNLIKEAKKCVDNKNSMNDENCNRPDRFMIAFIAV